MTRLGSTCTAPIVRTMLDSRAGCHSKKCAGLTEARGHRAWADPTPTGPQVVDEIGEAIAQGGALYRIRRENPGSRVNRLGTADGRARATSRTAWGKTHASLPEGRAWPSTPASVAPTRV